MSNLKRKQDWHYIIPFHWTCCLIHTWVSKICKHNSPECQLNSVIVWKRDFSRLIVLTLENQKLVINDSSYLMINFSQIFVCWRNLCFEQVITDLFIVIFILNKWWWCFWTQLKNEVEWIRYRWVLFTVNNSQGLQFLTGFLGQVQRKFLGIKFLTLNMRQE